MRMEQDFQSLDLGDWVDNKENKKERGPGLIRSSPEASSGGKS